jgi:hypothetical protein
MAKDKAQFINCKDVSEYMRKEIRPSIKKWKPLLNKCTTAVEKVLNDWNEYMQENGK